MPQLRNNIREVPVDRRVCLLQQADVLFRLIVGSLVEKNRKKRCQRQQHKRDIGEQDLALQRNFFEELHTFSLRENAAGRT